MGTTPSGIADRIKILRERSGLTPRRLGMLAGLAPSHVATLEEGRVSNIQLETAAQLARVTGATPEWIAFGVGRAPSQTTVRKRIAAAEKKAA